MYTDQNKLKSLRIALHSLPTEIKDWVGSEQATYIQIDISNKLGLTAERAQMVNQLVARLLVQDLDPRDFINELSHELNISYQSAKTLAEEIEEKTLRQIEVPLRQDVGVDLKLIYFGQPQAKRAIEEMPSIPRQIETEIKPGESPTGPNVSSWLKPQETKNTAIPVSQEIQKKPSMELPREITAEVKPIEIPGGPNLSAWLKPEITDKKKTEENILPSPPEPIASPQKTEIGSGPKIDLRTFQMTSGAFGESQLKEKSTAPLTNQAPVKAMPEPKPEKAPDTPFILHQEGSAQQTSSPFSQERPAINLRIQHFSDTAPYAPNPTVARLETPTSPKTPQPNRIVHYSDRRTMINEPTNSKKPATPQKEEMINLETFTKVSGNTVDLRKNQK